MSAQPFRGPPRPGKDRPGRELQSPGSTELNRLVLSLSLAIALVSIHADAQRPVIPQIPEPLVPKIPEPLVPKFPELKMPEIPRPFGPAGLGSRGSRIPRPSLLPDRFGAGGPGRLPTSPFSRPTGSNEAPQASNGPPDSGGLMLPRGPIDYPRDGTNVLVRGDDGNSIVARLHVGVGSVRIVTMPDGRLEVVDESKTQPTDQKFVPISLGKMELKMLADPRLEGFKAIRSRRFLYVYNTSEKFIKTTRTILETMYPAIRKYFRRSSIDVHEPEFPLVILAFATENQYQEFRRMPRGVVAYYDTLSNQVALYEKSNLSTNAPEIAIKNAISTIAHEGSHQVLHNIGVQQRMSRWPLWLSEGIAEFFAPTSVDRGARWQGLGATNELRMHEIDSDWKKRKPTGSGQNLRRIVSADSLSSLDYAYSWGLIHTLSRRRQKELFACVRDCSDMRPLAEMAASEESDSGDAAKPSSGQEIFTKHFGTDFAKIESEMNRHLMSLNYVDPVANQTHYIVIAGGRVYMTTSPAKVQEIRKQVILGSAQVRTFPNRRAAEQAMAALTR